MGHKAKETHALRLMEQYQDTVNGLLKVQVDNFLDKFSRMMLDSMYSISRDISKSNMTFHFQNKEFEADLKMLPSFTTLYKRESQVV